MQHARRAEDDLGRLAHRRVGARQGRARRQLEDGDEVALVLLGNEAGRRAAELPCCQPDQPGIDDHHDRGEADQPAGERAVARRQPVEDVVEAVEEDSDRVGDAAAPAGRRAVRLMALEQECAQGWAQGQRDQARDHRGGRDRDGELPEELPRDARDERCRHEHGGQRQRDRDQGLADLVHGLVRGVARAHALAQIALDVLDHHDRIVDHDADRQHEPEQREVVEREAGRGEHQECANQGHRDRHDRDDRGAPGLQEQDHDDHDQPDRLVDRLDHLVDRFADELGRVVHDVVAQALGERLRELRHGRLEAVRGGERVGARLLEDQQRHRCALIEIAVGAVVLGAELDPRDVAHTRDPAVGIVLDHDVGELARIDQPAERLDVELEGALMRHRRLVEHAGGHLDVLRLQRLDDLAGGQVARGDPVGIEPDPHGVVARAEDLDVADAVEPRQHVLHLQGRVVRDVELVARTVRRIEMDHHHEVGRVLAHRDAEALNLVGQLRLRDRQAILHQNLGDIEIGAERERHRDRDVAVAGCLRDHVEHVLDAVDLLLDRRRDRLADHLRRRARIGRVDHHSGRRDLRILRDRQAEIGDAADQGDEHRQHRREDRAVDEEVREAHRGALSRRSCRVRSCRAAASPWRPAVRAPSR